MHASIAQPEPLDSADSPFEWGEVMNVTSHGDVTVSVDGFDFQAVLATHIPPVFQGQRVLVATSRMPGCPSLIIAAYPTKEGYPSAPFVFDAVSGTLQIRGAKLMLLGEQEVVIECGPASFVVTADGSIKTRGERLLSSAIETNRIEGGSIEFN